MKRIVGWYRAYADGVERFLTWISSSERHIAAGVSLILAILGLTWGWRPYRALAHGASLSDWITVYARSGPEPMQIWVAALFPTLFLLVALAIPLFALFPNVSLPSWTCRPCRKPRTRPKRESARKHLKDGQWRLLHRVDPESACFVLLFLLMVGFPMWRLGEALLGGESPFDSVNLSPWRPAALMPLWAGVAYVSIMSWLGQQTYRLIKQRPNNG